MNPVGTQQLGISGPMRQRRQSDSLYSSSKRAAGVPPQVPLASAATAESAPLLFNKRATQQPAMASLPENASASPQHRLHVASPQQPSLAPHPASGGGAGGISPHASSGGAGMSPASLAAAVQQRYAPSSRAVVQVPHSESSPLINGALLQVGPG